MFEQTFRNIDNVLWKEAGFDHDNALTGSDLIQFVSIDLFPYLHCFKERAVSTDTIEYKIGKIFGEIRNRLASGYSLRGALELIDELSFGSQGRPRSTSCRTFTKLKLKTWVTPGGTVANTTRRAH